MAGVKGEHERTNQRTYVRTSPAQQCIRYSRNVDDGESPFMQNSFRLRRSQRQLSELTATPRLPSLGSFLPLSQTFFSAIFR